MRYNLKKFIELLNIIYMLLNVHIILDNSTMFVGSNK